jgi:hypothetical protein
MRQRLVIPCLLNVLSGCTGVLQPQPLPPYTLSGAEMTAITRGIYSALEDVDEPSFRNVKAARSSGGDVYVCGWMSARRGGYRTAEQPFIGTLSAGRFSLERIAKDEYSTAEVLAKCRERGISI